MSDYEPTVWVDETGTGDGTVVTAARMNKIEHGIANRGLRVFEQPEAPDPDPEIGAVWVDTDAPDLPEGDGGIAFAFFNA